VKVGIMNLRLYEKKFSVVSVEFDAVFFKQRRSI